MLPRIIATKEKVQCSLIMRSRYFKVGSLRSNDADGDENVKKNNRFYKQNNSFARASHFFCTFLSRFCTTTT